MQVSSRHVLRPGRLPFLPFRCCAFAPCPERTPCQERSLYLPADCSRLRQSWQDLSRPACIPWADPQPGPVVFRLCEPPSVQTDVCRLFDLRRCVVYKNSNDNDYSIALGSKSFTSGVHEWEIVVCGEPGYDNHDGICVGVTLHTSNLGAHPYNTGTSSWYAKSSGGCTHRSADGNNIDSGDGEGGSGVSIRAGDTVRVTLDLTERVISFFNARSVRDMGSLQVRTMLLLLLLLLFLLLLMSLRLSLLLVLWLTSLPFAARHARLVRLGSVRQRAAVSVHFLRLHFVRQADAHRMDGCARGGG